MNLLKTTLLVALVCLVCVGLTLGAPNKGATERRQEEEEESYEEEADDEERIVVSSKGLEKAIESSAIIKDQVREVGVIGLPVQVKETPLSPQKLEVATPSDASRGVVKPELPKGPLEWAKLMFKPLELVKAISGHFKLPLEGVLDKIGRGYVFGLEAVLSPVVACVKIVEKVFVPDGCKLRFVCKSGQFLGFFKEGISKFSPGFMDTSATLRALAEGITGKECETIYPKCEPKLKKAFEALKQPFLGIGAFAGLVEEKKEAKLELVKVGGAKLSDGKQVAAEYVETVKGEADKKKKIF